MKINLKILSVVLCLFVFLGCSTLRYKTTALDGTVIEVDYGKFMTNLGNIEASLGGGVLLKVGSSTVDTTLSNLLFLGAQTFLQQKTEMSSPKVQPLSLPAGTNK